MIRLILGLIKGAVIGGGLGYGAYALGLQGGWNWIIYGLVGALVGLFVGQPIWRKIIAKNSTSVTSIIKAVFGFIVGCGLYALVAKVWGGFDLELNGDVRNVINWQFITGGVIGAIYGAFVEWDDTPPEVKEQKKLKS